MSLDLDEPLGNPRVAEESKFAIFRADAARGVRPAQERAAVRDDYAPPAAVTAGLSRFAKGAGDGAMARVLFTSSWAHVAYAWFKSGFPLPLHSHDADCFYQIIAGSLRIGTEEVGQGDSILIPAGVPYTVTPGANGVEFIEVRPTHDYDTRYRGTEVYWDRIMAVLDARKETWANEKPPFGMLSRSG